MALLGDPTSTGAWAQSFLSLLDDPLTASNIAYVEGWEGVESPSGYGYNPLGTEETEPGSQTVPQDVGTGYSVQAFKSASSGLLASVTTLTANPANSKLIALLKKGNATTAQLSAAQSAPGASWATGEEPSISSTTKGYGVSTPFTYGGVLGEQSGAPVKAGVSGSGGLLNQAYSNPLGAAVGAGEDVTSGVVSGIFGPIVSWVEKGAADVTFIGFGILLVLIGLAITFKSEEEDVAPAVAAA